MKKRLLSIFLVAFVLCTMAINSFAISNANGLPAMLDYAYDYKAFPQYDWQDSVGFTARVYQSGVCPFCGANVTYVNYNVSDDVIYTFFNGDVSSYFDKVYLLVGSFLLSNEYNFTSNSYNLKNVLLNAPCGLVEGGDDSDYWYNRYAYIWSSDFVTTTTFSNVMIHKDINTDLIGAGWYSALYIPNNQIGEQTVNIGQYLFNAYGDVTDNYNNLVKDWILKSFLSSPYQETLAMPYLDEAYSEGYSEGYSIGDFLGQLNGYQNGLSDGFDNGYDEGYDEGYDVGNFEGYGDGFNVGYDLGIQEGKDSIDVKNIYNIGYLEGQDSSDWTFMELFDGLFAGFGQFVSPFMSIGFNDITIGSLLGLIGIVYIVLLILRIIRG